MARRGRPPETTLADILGAFADRVDSAEPLTATDVADHVGCSRRTALDKLHELEERGDVVSKKVGGRSRVWWVPETGAENTSPAAPLQRLVGGLGPEAADSARERSDAWRESVDEELTPDEA